MIVVFVPSRSVWEVRDKDDNTVLTFNTYKEADEYLKNLEETS